MKKILGILILTIICCLNLMADLNEGLVAHYPFNGNANDESENGNHGTTHGEIQLTSDRFENDNCAYDFDGINDYIEIEDVEDFYFSNESVTFSIWVNLEDNQNLYRPFICLSGGSSGIHLAKARSGWENGSIYFQIFDGEEGIHILSLNGGNSLPLNQWLHIVGVINFEQSNIKLFIDNILQAEGDLTEFDLDNSSNLKLLIGKFPDYEHYHNSYLDDIRIYNRALSEEEIEEIYNGFIADFILPEIAYIGEPIQFTDTSTGNPTTWEWDFDNDGIYDSFIQNPTHIYNAEGIYSVKLKIANETLIDSLVKENQITVSYCPPAPPQNVNVEMSGDDAIISWAAVDSTICGSSIVPDLYLILYNEYPYDNPTEFYYHGYTTETNYTHFGVILYGNQGEPVDQMFYQIIAVKNYNREQIEYLEGLNSLREKNKWSEVKMSLKIFE